MDRRYDLATVLGAFALGLIMFVITRAMPTGMYRDAVGSRAFFFGIGFFFMIGSAILAINLLRSWKKQKGHMIPAEGDADEEGHPASALMALGVVGISILYAILLRPVGYLITTPLYLFAGMAILKERQWGYLVLFAVGFTVAFYMAFAIGLGMNIPVGPFTNLFRDLGWIIL